MSRPPRPNPDVVPLCPRCKHNPASTRLTRLCPACVEELSKPGEDAPAGKGRGRRAGGS